MANLTTLLVYGALSAALFLVVLELQQVTGYSALGSGAAIFPITLLFFSSPHDSVDWWPAWVPGA